MGAHDELGRRGKMGVGGACAVCCVAPMLVLAGLISIGTLLTFGVAAASIAAVVVVAIGVGSGRLVACPPRVRRVLFAVGGAAAFGGLLNVNQGARAATFIAVGLALFACCALLSLEAARPTDCPASALRSGAHAKEDCHDGNSTKPASPSPAAHATVDIPTGRNGG